MESPVKQQAESVAGKPDEVRGAAAGHGENTAAPCTPLPLPVGLQLFLEREPAQAGRKMRTEVVGHSEGEYIIVRTPRHQGRLVHSSLYEEFIVRYFLDGVVFGFQTRPIQIAGPPVNLWFVAYPRDLQRVSLRASPRVELFIPVRRGIAGPKNEAVLDLSATGALLKLSECPEVRTSLEVSFVLPNGQPVENLGALVRRVERTETGSLTGVEFDREHPDFPHIERYLTVARQALHAYHQTSHDLPQDCPPKFQSMASQPEP